MSIKQEEAAPDSKALIKMSELSTFFKKLEEVIGCELDQLQDYILKLFSISKKFKYDINCRTY